MKFRSRSILFTLLALTCMSVQAAVKVEKTEYKGWHNKLSRQQWRDRGNRHQRRGSACDSFRFRRWPEHVQGIFRTAGQVGRSGVSVARRKPCLESARRSRRNVGSRQRPCQYQNHAHRPDRHGPRRTPHETAKGNRDFDGADRHEGHRVEQDHEPRPLLPWNFRPGFSR